MASRIKRIVPKLLLAVAAFGVALLVCEAVLRLSGWTAPIFTEPDSHLGVRLVPNAEGWWREEGATYLKINSAGFRDREHSKSKPAGTFRIAVLGDSYAEARQVSMEATFWSIMEKRLAACANLNGKRIEVLNFGVSGYGTAQELIMLRREVWAYSPDLVLLAFSTGNDIRDNSPTLSQDGTRPFFVYRNEQLVLDDSALVARDSTLAFRLWRSPPGRVMEWFRQHSRVVQLINRAQVWFADYRISRRRTEVATNINKSANVLQLTEPGLDYMVYYEPKDAVWKEAWKITEGTLVLMRDEVQSKGAAFAVVTLSNGIQVSPYHGASEYSYDISYPDRRIKALGERENFPVLNLAPILSAYAVEHKVYLHGFDKNLGMGHWNEEGHRQAGDAMSTWVCGLIGPVQGSR